MTLYSATKANSNSNSLTMHSRTRNNIPCAYCHIDGHHIKYCPEIAKKKAFELKSIPIAPTLQPLQKKSTIPVSNHFALLFAEEEEGEIVEDRSSQSSVEDVILPEKWTRSGIKGASIPLQINEPQKNPVVFQYSADTEKILTSNSDYVAKFKGMKWADIDSEEEDN